MSLFGQHTEYEREIVRLLERILEESREGTRILRRIAHTLTPPPSRLTEVNVMSIPSGPVQVGASDTFSVVDDAADSTQVVAANTAASNDTNIATVTLTDNGDGTASGTWTAVGPGSASITVTGTDAAGNVVSTGTNNPFAITVGAAAEPLASVNVS